MIFENGIVGALQRHCDTYHVRFVHLFIHSLSVVSRSCSFLLVGVVPTGGKKGKHDTGAVMLFSVFDWAMEFGLVLMDKLT